MMASVLILSMSYRVFHGYRRERLCDDSRDLPRTSLEFVRHAVQPAVYCGRSLSKAISNHSVQSVGLFSASSSSPIFASTVVLLQNFTGTLPKRSGCLGKSTNTAAEMKRSVGAPVNRETRMYAVFRSQDIARSYAVDNRKVRVPCSLFDIRLTV